MTQDNANPDMPRPANDAGPKEASEAVLETGGEAMAQPAASGDDRIAALEAQVAELKDQHLRTLAEMENLRRRAQREREEAAKFGATGLARDLLTVSDNLRRALESVPEETRRGDQAVASLLDGVEMVERELLAAFERNGIRKIDPQGERFDHNLHQAMFELENTGQPAGTVVQVLQPGYVLHGRLLRAAMVGVAKGEAPPAGAPKVDTRI